MFPLQRGRRLRFNESIRSLVRETTLSPSDFMFPMFIAEGENVKIEIPSMPGGCLVLTLTFVAGGTVPVLGGLFTLLGICAVLAGLGAAAATRFGTRRARPAAAALPDA